MEVDASVPQVGVYTFPGFTPSLSKAIDYHHIVMRRLRELGGPGQRGSWTEGADGSSGPVTSLPDMREDTWAQKVGRRAPRRGRGRKREGDCGDPNTSLGSEDEGEGPTQ